MPDTPIVPLFDNDREEVFLTREEAITELRALVKEGLESGPSKYVSMEDLKREILRRLEASRDE